MVIFLGIAKININSRSPMNPYGGCALPRPPVSDCPCADRVNLRRRGTLGRQALSRATAQASEPRTRR